MELENLDYRASLLGAALNVADMEESAPDAFLEGVDRDALLDALMPVIRNLAGDEGFGYWLMWHHPAVYEALNYHDPYYDGLEMEPRCPRADHGEMKYPDARLYCLEDGWYCQCETGGPNVRIDPAAYSDEELRRISVKVG